MPFPNAFLVQSLNTSCRHYLWPNILNPTSPMSKNMYLGILHVDSKSNKLYRVPGVKFISVNCKGNELSQFIQCLKTSIWKNSYEVKKKIREIFFFFGFLLSLTLNMTLQSLSMFATHFVCLHKLRE